MKMPCTESLFPFQWADTSVLLRPVLLYSYQAQHGPPQS